MRQTKVAIGLILLATVLTVAGVFVFPVPSTWKLDAMEFYVPFAGNAMMACLHVGAAIIFIMNMGVYKAKLRRAYTAIAAGIVLIALGSLQVSLVGALNLWGMSWVQQGGLVVPFVVSSIILYFATRSFARLVGMRQLLTQAWVVLGIVLVITVGTSFLPHVATSVPEAGYDVAVATIAWSACLTLVAALLIAKIQGKIGAHYVPAMTWLAFAFFVSFLILAIQVFYTLITTDATHWLGKVSTVLAIVSGCFWLCAGYAFARTKEY